MAGRRNPVACSVFPEPSIQFATSRQDCAAVITPGLLYRDFVDLLAGWGWVGLVVRLLSLPNHHRPSRVNATPATARDERLRLRPTHPGSNPQCSTGGELAWKMNSEQLTSDMSAFKVGFGSHAKLP